MSVRPARAGDAVEIGRIQVETWRTAYADILPRAVLDGITSESAVQAWSTAITAPPSPRHHVLVAAEGEWVVGFVAFGPASDLEEDDPQPASTVGVAPLLVEPRWGRRGHGSRLLAATVDIAREDAMTRAIAWVPEEDRVSRDFLQSAGWAPDGLARALDTGAGELREVRFHTALDDGDTGAAP